jgi:hypothetical protein
MTLAEAGLVMLIGVLAVVAVISYIDKHKTHTH